MSKINKKSINYGFKIMAFLAFSILIIPTQASAERAGYVTPYNSTSFNRVYKAPEYNYDYNSPAYYQPYQPLRYAYISPTPAPAATPTVYSSSANPNGSAGATSGTASSSNAVANTGTNSANTGATNTNTGSDNLSNIAANTIYGSPNSFLPSGLMQWIMVAIFILLIVILSRRIFGMKEEYETTPLKHA